MKREDPRQRDRQGRIRKLRGNKRGRNKGINSHAKKHARAAEMKAKFPFQSLLVVVISCNHHSGTFFLRQFYSHCSLALLLLPPDSDASFYTRNSYKCRQGNTYPPSPRGTELVPAVPDGWPFPGEYQVPTPLKSQLMLSTVQRCSVLPQELTAQAERGNITHTTQTATHIVPPPREEVVKYQPSKLSGFSKEERGKEQMLRNLVGN